MKEQSPGSAVPLQCHKCKRFLGRDGYPDVIYDDYAGGYEEGYSLCGPCGRMAGRAAGSREAHKEHNPEEP